MTKEDFFEANIASRLDDVISWKVVLCFSSQTIDSLLEMGLVRNDDPVNQIKRISIVSGDYVLLVERPFLQLVRIQKGDKVLYEYTEQDAFEKNPKVNMLDVS